MFEVSHFFCNCAYWSHFEPNDMDFKIFCREKVYMFLKRMKQPSGAFRCDIILIVYSISITEFTWVANAVNIYTCVFKECCCIGPLFISLCLQFFPSPSLFGKFLEGAFINLWSANYFMLTTCISMYRLWILSTIWLLFNIRNPFLSGCMMLEKLMFALATLPSL